MEYPNGSVGNPGGTTGVPQAASNHAHSVWSRLFNDVTPPRTREATLRQKCETVSSIIQSTATGRDLQLQEQDWQVEASAWALLGYDVSVIAATSDGKSFCYQLLAMVALGKCVLVMSPLVALIADQVSWS